MIDFATLDWWTDFAENWINAMTPKSDPSPEDRDTENPDIETPVPVNEPNWMDTNYFKEVVATLTPDEYRRMLMGNFASGLEAAQSDDLTAYHSHLCECPACAMADGQRTARMKDYLSRNSLW